MTGDKAISPAALRKHLTDNRGAVSAILDQHQEARLRRILVEAEKANAVHTATVGGGSDTFENASMMTSIVGRVIGARIASVVAPGSQSLQAAQMGSKLGLRFVESLSIGQANALIEQAMLDPKVLKDLLTRPTNLEGGQRVLVEKLRSHLAAAGMPTPENEDQSDFKHEHKFRRPE